VPALPRGRRRGEEALADLTRRTLDSRMEKHGLRTAGDPDTPEGGDGEDAA